MSDISTLGPRMTVTVGERKILLLPPVLDDFVEIQQWLNDRPNPAIREAEVIKVLPAELQKLEYPALIERAKQWPPRLGTPAATALLQSMEGAKLLMTAMVRRGDPALTRVEASELAGLVPVGQIGEALKVAFGGDDEDASPKGEAGR